MKTIFKAAMAVLITLAGNILMAQTQKAKSIIIPFEASRFDTSQRKAMFMNAKGMKIMMISPSATRNTTPVTLKGLNFTNGTIEFDARPSEGDVDDAITINFHQRDVFNFESLYLRIQADETLQRADAIQYSPYIHGVNLWDIMTPYRGYALIHNKDWNHFKLVISGLQMLVYVNSNKPTLSISRLEGNTTAGSISFDGEATFANLVIKPGQTEGLSPDAGMDLTDNDPTYVRKWEVTKPRFIAMNQELTAADLPTDTTQWQPIVAERRGLINLNRKFEGPEFTSYPKSRRYVWLRTTIRSDKKQNVKLQLGFNKEVYVFINKELLYIDKNEAGELYQKYPGGRLDVSNTSFNVPLKEGPNELMIGIAVKDYGWGYSRTCGKLAQYFY